MAKVARLNEEKAKQDAKHWYDRNARHCEFTDGDQVLVLLPAGHDKLSAQWQGPYTVTGKVSPVSYTIDMVDKRKRHRQFHVNMMKAWHTPTAAVLAVSVQDDDLDEEIITPLAQAQGQPELSSSLSTQQRAELNCLLDEMSDVFSDVPGTVDSVEHCIDTGEAPPFRLPPYRIPKAWESQVHQELQSLAI